MLCRLFMGSIDFLASKLGNPLFSHLQTENVSCSPLGSGTVQFKMAGEILVKPHESAKTGYKAPNAYGARPIFSDET